jgi:hypothetical protein
VLVKIQPLILLPLLLFVSCGGGNEDPEQAFVYIQRTEQALLVEGLSDAEILADGYQACADMRTFLENNEQLSSLGWLIAPAETGWWNTGVNAAHTLCEDIRVRWPQA